MYIGLFSRSLFVTRPIPVRPFSSAGYRAVANSFLYPPIHVRDLKIDLYIYEKRPINETNPVGSFTLVSFIGLF